MALRRPRPKQKLSKKFRKAQAKQALTRAALEVEAAAKPVAPPIKKPVQIPPVIAVKELALALDVPVTALITQLVKGGIMATINQPLDYETAAIVAEELGFAPTPLTTQSPQSGGVRKDYPTLPRAPVVTVMGHVDHGKTTLLDAIRQSDVVSQESGGITQHIGAYQVEVDFKEKNKIVRRPITFLDTPGHEAFTQMRAHGANVTDVVVLVIAATEGVKAQTTESIAHAASANVPIVVALTKIDLPEANVERTKTALADAGLLSEQWGGQIPIVAVSAPKGTGVHELLETILLVADLKELKARRVGPAAGVVLEARVSSAGPVATVLVQEGTLNLGDLVVAGQTFGKVRALENDRNQRLKAAGPSAPVRVLGLAAVPFAGDRIIEVPDEKTARQLVQGAAWTPRGKSLAELSKSAREGALKELPVIVKSDVQGSLDAILSSLQKISASSKITIKVVHGSVGAITDSDVQLAIASGAVILGFHVKPSVAAEKIAEQEHVDIRTYTIIYKLTEDLEKTISGILKHEKILVEVGRVRVLKIFKQNIGGGIYGVLVLKGPIYLGCEVRVTGSARSAAITSLQRERSAVQQTDEGLECGIGTSGGLKLKEGDELTVWTEKTALELSS